VRLLEGIEVACFDLFETLIRVDTRQLPEVTWKGRSIRSSIPIVHERHFAERGVALSSLMDAIGSMWQEVRAELKQEDAPDDERWREIPAVEKFRRMLERLDRIPAEDVPPLAEAIAITHHETLVSAAIPMPGAQDVLERVRVHGCRTVLVSNWDHARAGAAMLEQTGLTRLLDHVVISEDVGFRKPHPLIFEQALAPFDARPEAAIHVGDLAGPDAWGAGRLGFKTVWIDASDDPWPADLVPSPTLRVCRLADLLQHL